MEGGHAVLAAASEGCPKAGLRGEREPDDVTTPRYIATRHSRPAGPVPTSPYPVAMVNAGGEVRGLERAEDVANPQGVQHGIDKAERKIETKNNPRNPNTQTQGDTDTTNSKPSSRK